MYSLFEIRVSIILKSGDFWRLQNLHLSFLEEHHGWFWGMLWISVLLEYSTSLQLQCLDWPLNISPSIFVGIYSSFDSHNISFAPSCHTTPKHHGSTSHVSQLTSWLYPFLSKHTFFGGGQNVTFWFHGPKHIVPKGVRLLLHTSDSSFCVEVALATLPCRSLLFKVRSIIVLWTARPVFATLFCSSFAVVWVLLSISHQVSGHSILNLSWSSRSCL